jgi:uncharacterized protein with von Willebrand factor type A (vWA) domain
VVTDGEPTAHLEPAARPSSRGRRGPRTLRKAVAEVDILAKLGASVMVLILGDDPSLERFVDLVARRSGGRVVARDVDGLGLVVVGDCLRSRCGR